MKNVYFVEWLQYASCLVHQDPQLWLWLTPEEKETLISLYSAVEKHLIKLGLSSEFDKPFSYSDNWQREKMYIHKLTWDSEFAFTYSLTLLYLNWDWISPRIASSFFVLVAVIAIFRVYFQQRCDTFSNVMSFLHVSMENCFNQLKSCIFFRIKSMVSGGKCAVFTSLLLPFRKVYCNFTVSIVHALDLHCEVIDTHTG